MKTFLRFTAMSLLALVAACASPQGEPCPCANGKAPCECSTCHKQGEACKHCHDKHGKDADCKKCHKDHKGKK
jgi:hypothetical protein